MDKIISTKEQQKGLFKKYASILAIVLVALGALWLFRQLITPSIKHNDIITAQVQQGDLNQTLTASGLVVPAYEIEINAPVSTEIKEVKLSSGSTVTQGDLIMLLDQELVDGQYQQLKDEFDLKQNNITRLKLEFDKNLKELDYDNQISSLQLEQLATTLKDKKHLLSIGGATTEDVEQAELALKIAQLQNKKLTNELDFRKKSNKTDKRNLELELNIQEKKVKEWQRKLAKTKVKAPQDGVITWINEDLGRKINEGELIARLANLSKFKIEATCSDRYLEKIKTGMPVNVRINNNMIEGTVNSILPAIDNNNMKFTVALNDNIDLLRPNMRVEVFVVTAQKQNVLKLKRGAGIKGVPSQYLFKVEGDQAIKQKITAGITDADYIEITTGAKAGDKFIISTTKDFEHLDQIDLNK